VALSPNFLLALSRRKGKVYQGGKKMRKDEIAKKNIGVTFDFIRAAVADPHLLDKIPNGAEIEFLETDLPRIETEERTNEGNPSVFFKIERNFQVV
jgi:hypothetical protein